ncbi:mariner Mos1 transposase [Trichonephila clavipes]|nr:mariner Mos1 transposase [Trichonephila clavipes]
MLENNPHLTSQEIAEEFGIHHTTVEDHIKYLGIVLKRRVWVPHELTENNLSDRVRICLSHLIRHNEEPFLGKQITGDEKWILYENSKRKKSYCKPGTTSATVQKPSIHQRKVLLCLWRDKKGPMYYELLKQGKTINADLYCNQLDKLNATIKEKNARFSVQKRNSVPPRYCSTAYCNGDTTKTECVTMGSPWSPTLFTWHCTI